MFTIRKTKPGKANLEYTTKSSGGWSSCIKGKPTDANANVLSNCVGYSQGRFCEAYNEIFKTTGNKYFSLNCNAESFIERAKSYYPNLKFSDVPVPGSIICWAKGKVGVSSDGAGHVGFVEQVIDSNTIYTSESNYGGTAFLNATRKNNNGRWGLGSAYTFRAFIYDPEMVETYIPDVVGRNEWVDQVEIVKDTLRVRVIPSTKGFTIKLCPMGIYNVKEIKVADGYTWYKLDEAAWVAGVEGSLVYHKAKEVEIPKPVEKDTSVSQVFIGDISLRMRAEPNTTSKVQGLAEKESYYNVLEVEEKEDYTWYKLADFVYVAGVSGVTYYPFVSSPEVAELKAQIEKLTSELNIFKDINASLTTENKKLTSDLSKANTTINNQTKQIESLNKDISKKDEKLTLIKGYADQIVAVYK